MKKALVLIAVALTLTIGTAADMVECHQAVVCATTGC
jgi:hypothetical protein